MTRTFLNLPVGRYADVLSWDDRTVERLAGHVYEAAMRVGIHIDEEEYLREIERKGGKVDWGRRAVVPSRRELDEVCEILRKTNPAEGHLRSDPAHGEGFKPVTVGNGGNLIFDWESWSVKAPTAGELRIETPVRPWQKGARKGKGVRG